jgi:chemotaxis protein MotA
MTTKTIISLCVAAVVCVAALALGGDIAIFVNPIGLLVVVGGTLAGVFLAFPMDTMRDLWLQMGYLARRKVLSNKELEKIFYDLARLQRAEGSLALEEPARAKGNPFLELGVTLVVDGLKPIEVRERLEQEFEFFFSRRSAQRAVLSLMGRLAPALGLAGTMIGLIRMLHTVKDPAAVAEGMSVALLTTFYGIMLANLLILPLERKLGELTRAEAVEMTLITEGVMGLALGLNGAAIQTRLGSFRKAGQPHRSIPSPAANTVKARASEMRSWVRGVRSFRTAGSVGNDS